MLIMIKKIFRRFRKEENDISDIIGDSIKDSLKMINYEIVIGQDPNSMPNVLRIMNLYSDGNSTEAFMELGKVTDEDSIRLIKRHIDITNELRRFRE